MDQLIKVELTDMIATVTLNNPATRNALSRELIVGLANQIEGLMSEPLCRVIVLTGAGGTFSSGGDISRMTSDRQILDSRIWLKTGHRMIRAIVNGEKPVLSAVEGYAFGAGLSLAAGSEYVVAADNAKFCAAFAKVGLIPDMGLFYTLAQRVGVTQAKRLIMLAETVDAQNAHRLGIVDLVVGPGAALAEALNVARQYVTVAPLPLALSKAVYARGCTTLDEALQAEVDHQSALFLSEDHQAAVRSFREKKIPVFRGR